MGHSPSSLRSKGGRRSFRGFARKSKLNQSGLSHTFSLPPSEEYPELMNINAATEEQLMTLPGVSRQLATAIVRHRQMIGRFKRVDDLALVSGIGAEKLELLRPEICTNIRKVLSRASSCTHSLESVRVSSDKLCSINSASVFQLQCVPGLNQELAANIVDYRNKKGPFKSLDNLIKVRGIDIIRLSAIKQHLSLETRKCESVQQLTNGHANGWPSLNGSITNGVTNGVTSTPKHKKSLSMPPRFPVTLPNGFAAAPVNDILDLLSAYSHRPIVEEDFDYERDGVRCCRVASWNVSQLDIEKISNPGVREVICRTILENKLSLVALQEATGAALRCLRDELNAPRLRRVREWRANSHRWESRLGRDGLGFLFDTASKAGRVEDVDLQQLQLRQPADGGSRLLELLAELDSCGDGAETMCQAFLIAGRPLLVVNVRAPAASPALLQRLRAVGSAAAAAAPAAAPAAPPVAVVGEFGCWENVAALANYTALVERDAQTTLDPKTPGQGNILCGGGEGFNGRWGVVRSGLSHLAIPRGWSWGGPASPHCPLWAEFNLPD